MKTISEENITTQEVSGFNPELESQSIDSREIETAFGESLSKMLDIETWLPGEDLASMYSRLEAEVEQAVRQESRIRERIRQEVFPRLEKRPGAPAHAGVFRATIADIEKIHRGLLFNGGVEACDGTSVIHDSLPLTIVQIGICLVSYHRDQGSWVHRLYRRDLRATALDPVEEALQVLERRQKRTGFDVHSHRDKLTDLARRGMMTYAERAVLFHKSESLWRMGHGSPAPYELLTGSGNTQLLSKSLDLLTKLIGYKRFVFIPSTPNERTLLTIGDALRPLEYAIVDTVQDTINRIAAGHYRGEWAKFRDQIEDFSNEFGPQIVIGIYRASDMAPAQIFYAHLDYAHEAALIALADSVLQEHRGFPMLIDLANTVCSATFGGDTFSATTQLAYAEAGEPFRFMPERKTRR